MTKKIFYVAILAIAIAALLGVSRPGRSARQPAAAAIPMNSSDIAGVVTSSKGPEAGVWVIAETKDLGTGYRKIVVTDDQGRYLLPDLPKANYTVWVRGYGLVDSAKVQTAPGKPLDLKAVIAPSEKEAAQYYPALTGIPCSTFLRRAISPAQARAGMASLMASRNRANGLNW